jgi:hypothetical protein
MNRYSFAIVLWLASSAAALSGCCGQHHHHHAECCGPSFACFGYHSTCWRPWPEECTTCPSFAILPPPQETILKDMPLGHEPLPPAEVTPMPPAENEPAPVVDPPQEEEGRKSNSQIRKVSKKRIRVVPADNR